LSGRPQPLGSVDVALSHASRLLPVQPGLAAEQAAEILKVVPGHPMAILLLAVARRTCGDPGAALGLLQQLCASQPRSAAAHYELGVTHGSLGQGDAAIAALKRAVDLNPNLPDAWRALGDHLVAIGDPEGADAAYARHLKAATKDPRLLAAAAALVENRVPHAEALLRAHLKLHPTDVAALRMLAEVAGRLRRYADAERILATCLALAPSFDGARHNYATVLNRQGKAAAALPQVEQLLAREPRNPGFRNLKAAILANLGDYAASASVYAEVLKEYPQQSKVWMSYGHSLKTSGRVSEAIDAYRRAIAIEPHLGEAWWSLANLKTFRFADADVHELRGALARSDLSDDERLHFEFALGKALEDRASYEESFARYAAGNSIRRRLQPYSATENSDFVRRSKALFTREFFAARSFARYAAGNSIRRRLQPYSATENSDFVRRSKALFTREFFAARPGCGAPARDPIFIIGLPRSGSTLLEQILASHSLVEGTMELPDIPQLARELARRGGRDEAEVFFESVAALGSSELRALGERYLEGTRVFRKMKAPYFIDKMPNNCLYVGLIHLILPRATIIDARRHPLGCGLSCFKQHFARGQSFTYSLEDLGRYYRDYVELMAHFDAVLPGRVQRVLYETMVEDTAGEVRRLLAHCGLPVRDHGRGHRGRGTAAARAMWSAVRGKLPEVLPERARGAHRELRAGAPADLPRRGGSVAAL